MFENLRQPKKDAISDMRGLIDPTNLKQFNLYEGGYSLFTVVSIPKFMQHLATSQVHVGGVDSAPTYSDLYGNLITSYVKLLEQEFKGLDGIENITTENGEFTNGLTTIQMINKVTEPSNSNFSLRYNEKAGAIITRTHELYLKSIKDPKTGFKTYSGLLKDGVMDLDDAGFDSEVFSFLYMITDNTGYRLEKAYYIVGAQPTTAELSLLYNTEKGSFDFKELNVEFTGYALTGTDIDLKAKNYLAYLTGYTYTSNDKGVDGKLSKQNAPHYTFSSVDYSDYAALTEGKLGGGTKNVGMSGVSALNPDSGQLNVK